MQSFSLAIVGAGFAGPALSCLVQTRRAEPRPDMNMPENHHMHSRVFRQARATLTPEAIPFINRGQKHLNFRACSMKIRSQFRCRRFIKRGNVTTLKCWLVCGSCHINFLLIQRLSKKVNDKIVTKGTTDGRQRSGHVRVLTSVESSLPKWHCFLCEVSHVVSTLHHLGSRFSTGACSSADKQ